LEDGDYEWACFAAIRRKSFGSVVVYSVDRVAVEEALDRFVTACREREEVLAVVLFGSFARGGFGVGSDVDVFPYTLAEIRAGQPLAEEALRTGRILWRREGVDEKMFSSTEDPSTVHDASS
jgi:predicted nucleotidyltransferase